MYRYLHIAWLLLAACTSSPHDDKGAHDTDATNPADTEDTVDTEDTEDPQDTEVPTDELDCTPGAYTLPEPPTDSCVVQELSCGDTIDGSTAGGSTSFDRDVWEAAMCLDYLLLDPGHLDAPERVFHVTIPTGMFGAVALTSPCARLDLRTVNTDLDCNTSAQNCTAASGTFASSTVNSLVGGSSGERYEIIVDGYDGDEGNFRLSVDCWE